MALQFNHVRKESLETLFEKDLTRTLHQYHNGIISETLKRKQLYNDLRDNYIFNKGENKLNSINEMLTFDSSNVFDVVRNYLGISYVLGANQVLQEFEIDKKHSLTHFEKREVLQETESVMGDILSSYYDMLKEILIKNISMKSPFPTYINEIHEHFNKSKFKKRKTFIPSFPTIKNVVNNLKIAVTSKVMVKGMTNLLSKVGGVTFMRYQTQEDEKVSSKCRKWHNRRLPTSMIDGIIPQHMNCRCRWIPDT